MMPLFLGRIGFTEILILVLLIVVLFGAKKIPELMRGMGSGVKAFKEGMEGKSEEPKSDKEQ